MKEQKSEQFVPLGLFIYYTEREIEGTVDSVSGAQIRDGIKSVNKLGAPPEDPDWPYDIATFSDRPPTPAYAHAKEHQTISDHRVTPTLGLLKGRPGVNRVARRPQSAGTALASGR